jgi:N-acetylglucosaminyldiphosphoundecaprenol N-acetyl-beta-D-mannosaminyltransferase
MQRAGLEWSYRLYKEPRRLWRRYVLGIPRFLLGVLRNPPKPVA